MENKLIAVVGMCGSGKSVACDLLEKKGYQKVYFGGVIYDKMNEEGIVITPDSQKEFRENLRNNLGMGAVAILLLPKIKELIKIGNVVLDGLYSWDEYKILIKEFPNLKLVGVITDKKLRYERIGSRKDRPFSREDAIKRDIAEIENSDKGGPIAYADYFIYNNKSLDDYKQRLEEILKEMK